MKFSITAVIAEIGAIETVGQNGFQKRNLILTEQNGDYINPVCIEWSGEKIARPDSHQVGQEVTVEGFINCRQWEDKYFTSLAGSFIKNTGEQPQQAQQAQPQQSFGQAPQSPQFAQPPVQHPQAQQPVAPQAPQQFAQPVAAQNSQPTATPQQLAQQPIAQNMGAPMLDQNGNPLPF